MKNGLIKVQVKELLSINHNYKSKLIDDLSIMQQEYYNLQEFNKPKRIMGIFKRPRRIVWH